MAEQKWYSLFISETEKTIDIDEGVGPGLYYMDMINDTFSVDTRMLDSHSDVHLPAVF